MIIEFYTESKQQYVIADNKIFINGEPIISGTINIHHLTMNEPSWIVISRTDNPLPYLIKTDKVTAVLPRQQVYDGRPLYKEYDLKFLEKI